MKIDAGIAFGHYNFTDLDASPERILTLMEKNRIDRALACSLAGGLYDCAEGNDETAAVCASNPRLLPVGAASLGQLSQLEEELVKGRERGFRAFRLFSELTGNRFDTYSFKTLMELLEKHKMPLIVSCSDTNLSAFYGTDIAKAVCGFDVKVIALNASGYQLAELIEICRAVPNIWFTPNNFNVSGAVEVFCDRVGADRLIFATGLPVLYPGQSMVPIENSSLTEKEKQMIFSGNLQGLVGEIA